MNYQIVILEKKIQPDYKKAMNEYLKRLSKYCTINVAVVKKEVQAKKFIQRSGRHIWVTEGKETIESTVFAENIEDASIHGISNMTFYIGAFEEEKIKEECFYLSSFSMTEDLKATILLEQIYRSYRIIHHQAYHK
ncbi:MAG: 23S rRNA (pseudouridine(1915)-N(3))-methyltransferase RlmH [Anaerostipes sp.]|nr:23S rRNA (pseudouridine(1915)-N(3))-methyltransferase RlmH [Anaerostipes sp.]